MNTNETQSKEWAGDGWRVIARPGQVIYIVPLLGFWNGTMQDNQDSARASLRMTEALKLPHAKAFKAAIAYAWPKRERTAATERQ